MNVNGVAKIFKTQKYSELKQHVKKWTEKTYKTYKVVGIDRSGINGQTTYKLEGLSKALLRHASLLVE